MAKDYRRHPTITCPYLHRICGRCKKSVCRAYFPEKQPYITDATLPTCKGKNYEKECLIYPEAVKWRKEKRKKSLQDHCPFAQNTVCGKPWLWICKGSITPFFLTDVEMTPQGSIIRDADMNLIFKPDKSIDDIKDTCLSGDEEIYHNCPHYVDGVAYREYVKRVKKGEKP